MQFLYNTDLTNLSKVKQIEFVDTIGATIL